LRSRTHHVPLGYGAPQEKAQPRGKLDVADAIGPRGGWRAGPWRARWGGRRSFEPEQEMRIRQDALDRQANARFEVSVAPAFVVEAHQVGEIGVRHGPAIRLRGEAPDDPGRTRGLFARIGRTARQNPAAARRVRDPGDAEWSRDGEILQVRRSGDAEARADPRFDQHVIDRRQQIVDWSG